VAPTMTGFGTHVRAAAGQHPTTEPARYSDRATVVLHAKPKLAKKQVYQNSEDAIQDKQIIYLIYYN